MKEKKVRKPRSGEVKRFRDARGVVLTLKLQEKAFNDHRITSQTISGRGEEKVVRRGQPERFLKKEDAATRFDVLVKQAIDKRWVMVSSRARFDYTDIPDASPAVRACTVVHTDGSPPCAE